MTVRSAPGFARLSAFGFGVACKVLPVLASLVVAPAVWGQFSVLTLKSLGVPDETAAQSRAPLIVGSDGALYGTTQEGGGAIRGTVFKLSDGGNKLEVLHRFPEFIGDGAVVYGGVIEAENGLLYGTTGEGGISNKGTIFCLNRDGNGYRVLRSFTGANGDGAQGFGSLTEGSDHWLYGTTRFGGSANKGTVFRIDSEGGNYQVLHSFTGTHSGGAEPAARVVEGPDGRLYGTTYGATIEGAVTNEGTVFALNRDGTGHTVLRQFTGQGGDGANPFSELTVGRDGLLYGSTSKGGASTNGILFRLRPDGSEYQMLHAFGSVTEDGRGPFGPVVEIEEGILYGTTSLGGTSNDAGVVFTLQRDGMGYALLRKFVGDATDGAVPMGGVVKGTDGALYGTTRFGGAADKGTIFRVQPDGSGYEVLQRFTGAGGDAAEPYTGVSPGTDGAFYGTSWGGGNAYRGTVYRISPEDGEGQVLHEFAGGASDGATPYGGVIEGSDGVLYGTAVQGGTANLGIIYKLNKDGSGFAILRSFVQASNGGYYPYGRLIEGSDGLLYGTTTFGGSGGYGTIFRINRNGGSYSVFRNFLGGNDGAYPYAGVVEGSDGLLYGVTANGGGSDRGIVFRIRRGGGDFTVLRRFTGSEGGRNPYGRLLIGDDGVLYGTTSNGGRSDSGMVFRVARNGSDYQSLYEFDGSSAEGINALGGLSEGPEGQLYGTTVFGGQWGMGTLFRLNKDGTAFSVHHHFKGELGGGANPSGELAKGTDGLLYGTSRAGGIGCGTIYRLVPQVSLTLEPGGLVGLLGPTGFVYSVQASVEATSEGPWQTITNVAITSNPTHIQLPGYGTDSKQFVRTVLAPQP